MHGGSLNRGRQALFLAAITLYLVVLAASLGLLSEEARLFPIIILSGAGILVLLKALSTACEWLTPYFEPELTAARDELPERTGATDAAPIGFWTAWGWVAATLALMYLVGFLAGTAIAIFAFSRWLCGDSSLVAGTVAAATVTFVYAVFVQALHLELGFGVVGALF